MHSGDFYEAVPRRTRRIIDYKTGEVTIERVNRVPKPPGGDGKPKDVKTKGPRPKPED